MTGQAITATTTASAYMITSCSPVPKPSASVRKSLPVKSRNVLPKKNAVVSRKNRSAKKRKKNRNSSPHQRKRDQFK